MAVPGSELGAWQERPPFRSRCGDAADRRALAFGRPRPQAGPALRRRGSGSVFQRGAARAGGRPQGPVGSTTAFGGGCCGPSPAPGSFRRSWPGARLVVHDQVAVVAPRFGLGECLAGKEVVHPARSWPGTASGSPDRRAAALAGDARHAVVIVGDPGMPAASVRRLPAPDDAEPDRRSHPEVERGKGASPRAPAPPPARRDNGA